MLDGTSLPMYVDSEFTPDGIRSFLSGQLHQDMSDTRLLWVEKGNLKLSNGEQTLEVYGIRQDAEIQIALPKKTRHGKPSASTINKKRKLRAKTWASEHESRAEDDGMFDSPSNLLSGLALFSAPPQFAPDSPLLSNFVEEEAARVEEEEEAEAEAEEEEEAGVVIEEAGVEEAEEEEEEEEEAPRNNEEEARKKKTKGKRK